MVIGFFQKAISQSGSTLNRWALQRNPSEMLRRLTAGLNIQSSESQQVVRKLQAVDHKSLVLAQYNESIMVCFRFILVLYFHVRCFREAFTLFTRRPLFLPLKGSTKVLLLVRVLMSC